MKNQKGALTLDLIFALVLVLSMTMLLGVFSFSLSIVESIQYLTFSSSRSYFASHINVQKQKELAEKKFDELSKSGSYQKILKKDWFDVSIDLLGDAKNIYSAQDPRDIFEGVRTKVTIGLLDLNLPLFGSTENDQPYQTFVTSFIGRESTSEECQNMLNKRFEAILRLSNYQSPTIRPQNYVAIDDNGC